MPKRHRVLQQKPRIGEVRVIVQIGAAQAGHGKAQAHMTLGDPCGTVCGPVEMVRAAVSFVSKLIFQNPTA